MTDRHRVFLALIGQVLCGTMLFSACASAKKPGEGPQRFSAGLPGVFVVGGIHEAHEGAKKYTYKRMEEILQHLSPDVLCVEVLQEHLDDGSDKGMPWDFRKFMVPAARRMGIPIRGIDWWNEEAGTNWQRLQNEAGQDPLLAPQVELIGRMFRLFTNYLQDVDFQEIHSSEFTALWASKNDFKYQFLARHSKYRPIVDFETERNTQITNKIMQVVRAGTGRRILVAVGIDHKYWIEKALRSEGIRVLSINELMHDWWK